jgi:hypothetical protein
MSHLPRRSLLERPPVLVAKAEEIARAKVSAVHPSAVVEDVDQAALDLDADDLEARGGAIHSVQSRAGT